MDDPETLTNQEESEEDSNENSSETNEPNVENCGISLNYKKKFWYNKLLNVYT